MVDRQDQGWTEGINKEVRYGMGRSVAVREVGKRSIGKRSVMPVDTRLLLLLLRLQYHSAVI